MEAKGERTKVSMSSWPMVLEFLIWGSLWGKGHEKSWYPESMLTQEVIGREGSASEGSGGA